MNYIQYDIPIGTHELILTFMVKCASFILKQYDFVNDIFEKCATW